MSKLNAEDEDNSSMTDCLNPRISRDGTAYRLISKVDVWCPSGWRHSLIAEYSDRLVERKRHRLEVENTIFHDVSINCACDERSVLIAHCPEMRGVGALHAEHLTTYSPHRSDHAPKAGEQHRSREVHCLVGMFVVSLRSLARAAVREQCIA
jgi:hypothetical protein